MCLGIPLTTVRFLMFHPTVIASGIHVKGSLHAMGDCIIDGYVEGDIFSKESVILEKNGCIKGYVNAPTIVVKGLFEGRIQCDTVKILPHGCIKGKIESNVFMMYPKALFEGIKTTVEKQYTQETKPTEFDTENILL